MMKATSIKEAMRRWEEKHPSKDITKTKEIGLQFQFPPIEKMDNALSIINNCQKLNLSSNMIEKINGLSSMRNLKILSLGRNYIKSLTGLEGVANTLEELWISYNFIEKVKGITVLQKLKVLYMAHNLVKDWIEFNKFQDLPLLEELFFEGNPLHETLEDEEWRMEVTRRLSKLKILDGEKLESVTDLIPT